MNVKYCMQCGGRNSMDAIACQKCSASFSATAANRTPPSSPIKITEEPEHLTQKKLKRGRVKPEVSPESELVKLPPAATESSGSIIDSNIPDEEEPQEDTNGEGVSLNVMPDISNTQGLEVAVIARDVVKGISFGEMVAQAKREKELAQTQQP